MGIVQKNWAPIFLGAVVGSITSNTLSKTPVQPIFGSILIGEIIAAALVSGFTIIIILVGIVILKKIGAI